MQIIETQRLVVRHLETDDVEAFYAITGDPDTTRYMDTGDPLSRELTEKWIAVSKDNYKTKGYGCSAVIEKATGDFIGFCGIVHHPEKPAQIEIIYAFKPSAWGKGYATEVVKAMLDYGFETCGLQKIIATIHPENKESVRVAEKAGMVFEKEETDEAGSPALYYASFPKKNGA